MRRSKKPSVISMLDKQTKPADLLARLKEMNACYCDAKLLQYNDLLTHRHQFWRSDRERQNTWLLHRIHKSSRKPTLKEEILLNVAQQEYCVTCFLKLVGIGRHRWYQLRKRSKAGQHTWVPKSSQRTAAYGTIKQHLIAWFDLYLHNVGDQMPDSNQVHLPSTTWTDILAYYNACRAQDEELQHLKKQDGTLPPVTLPTFTSIIHLYFPHVIIPAVQRFSKCTTCCTFATQKACTVDRDQHHAIQKQKQLHLQDVMAERRKYWKHRAKAKQNSQHYLSLIIDGMDQAKTTIPSLHPTPSCLAGSGLKTHVTGVLVHGHTPRAHVFVSTESTHNGSNLTIECIMRTLLRLQLDSKPRVLYVQMDNCCRENKNKYVFSFLAFLVQRGVFSKVKISFLPVGHTHEDIDQMFSRFAIKLARGNTESMPHLLQRLTHAYQPPPITTEIHKVCNWSGWIEDKCNNKLSGITKPRVFKIVLEDSGVRLYFKASHLRKTWRPAETNPPGFQLLLHSDLATIVPGPAEEEVVWFALHEVRRTVSKTVQFFRREKSEQEWQDRKSTRLNSSH